MWKFGDIAHGVDDGSLLQRKAFTNVDLEAILDDRDESFFEENWIKAYEDINERWKYCTTADARKSEIDLIREFAFKKCYEYSGQPEIAAYVCDDFELMAKAAAMRYDLRFVTEMMRVYTNGGIPH